MKSSWWRARRGHELPSHPGGRRGGVPAADRPLRPPRTCRVRRPRRHLRHDQGGGALCGGGGGGGGMCGGVAITSHLLERNYFTPLPLASACPEPPPRCTRTYPPPRCLGPGLDRPGVPPPPPLPSGGIPAWISPLDLPPPPPAHPPAARRPPAPPVHPTQPPWLRSQRWNAGVAACVSPYKNP